MIRCFKVLSPLFISSNIAFFVFVLQLTDFRVSFLVLPPENSKTEDIEHSFRGPGYRRTEYDNSDDYDASCQKKAIICIALVTIHKFSGENNLQNCKTKFNLMPKEYTKLLTYLLGFLMWRNSSRDRLGKHESHWKRIYLCWVTLFYQ